VVVRRLLLIAQVEAGDTATVVAEIGAVALMAERAVRVERVLGAVFSRTESGREAPLNLDGLNRPVHDRPTSSEPA